MPQDRAPVKIGDIVQVEPYQGHPNTWGRVIETKMIANKFVIQDLRTNEVVVLRRDDFKKKSKQIEGKYFGKEGGHCSGFRFDK